MDPSSPSASIAPVHAADGGHSTGLSGSEPPTGLEKAERPRSSTTAPPSRAAVAERRAATTAIDPTQWSTARRWAYTWLLVWALSVFAVGSVIHAPAIPTVALALGCSETVSTLAVSAYFFGFAAGPLTIGPLSEVLGRRPVYVVTGVLSVLAGIAAPLAPDAASLIVFRFLAGFVGSSWVVNCAASIADLWPAELRSGPLAFFSAAAFDFPLLSQPICGYILQAGLDWRWIYWLCLILVCTATAGIVIIPETYVPVLVRKHPIDLAKEPSSWRDGFTSRLLTGLTNPWLMLFTEPIVAALALYQAFIYGLYYLSIVSYPIIFTEIRGWELGPAGFSFSGIFIGVTAATSCSPLLERLHRRSIRKIGPVPETRLPHIVVAAWVIPVCLFWFAWTALPPVPWIVPILAGVLFGAAFILLYFSMTAYLVDSYERYSASALAAFSVLRALAGATFPLFGKQMYHNLGTPWATMTIAFLSLALAPVPWIFYTWGARIRARSTFHTRAMRELAEERRTKEIADTQP